MKKTFNFFVDNIVQLIETVILICVVILPFLINLSELFVQLIMGNSLEMKDLIIYAAIVKGGNIAVAIILFFIAFYLIRKFNREFVMNKKNIYHDYFYAWYWYCAKILGINKCSLVLTPVYIQFRIVINSVFNEFFLEEKDYPVIEDEKYIQVVEPSGFKNNAEINMILEDRFLITDAQIPVGISKFPTIRICRASKGDQGRYYSPWFIQKVVSEVSKLPYGVTVNVLANTNPIHTKYIAQDAFKLADRGNIQHLFILKQENGPTRNFRDKKYKIY